MTANERIHIKRFVDDGVALLGTCSAVPGGVTFCFTERTGGMSHPPFASLNLGTKGGDDPACVAENRRRVMEALGAPELADTLVVPNQVHGDEVALITSAGERPACLEAGADAVVCTVPNQAVMLLFADCTPVVLVAPGGFAVAHSGWRGTLAGIAGLQLRHLGRAGLHRPAYLRGVLRGLPGAARYVRAAFWGHRLLGSAPSRHVGLRACEPGGGRGGTRIGE